MTPRPWASYIDFDSLGTVFGVRCTDPDLGEVMGEMFRHFPQIDGEPEIEVRVTHRGDLYRVEIGSDVVVEDGSRDKALVWVLARVNRHTIERIIAPTFHAGAVAVGEALVALPASGRAGKSTLVAACLKEGFDYVTDEAVVIASDDGTVVPYPKALWLSSESRRMLALDDRLLMAPTEADRYRAPVLPEELGGRVASGPLRLRHLVIPKRQEVGTSLQPAGGAETARQIVAHAFRRSERPEQWFRVAARLARASQAWVLSYDDIGAAARMLRHLVS